MNKTLIIIGILLLSIGLAYSRNPKNDIQRLDRPTDIQNLNDNFFDLFRYIEGYFVDKNTNQIINGNKTFTGSVNVSSFTATNEVITVYGFYHDRGDVAGLDYAVSNFVNDYNWYDLCLSSIVPTGAKAVSVFVSALGSTGGNTFELRKNGNVNAVNLSRLTCQSQTANVTVTGDYIVALDSNQTIEYRRDAGFSAINMVIKGWWK